MTVPTATKELIRKEAELIDAGLEVQGRGLNLLLAEMQALARLMPGAPVRHPTEAEIEEGFDNMPV